MIWMKVEFDIIKGPKGLQATHVSGPNGCSVKGDPNAPRKSYSGAYNYGAAGGNSCESHGNPPTPIPNTVPLTQQSYHISPTFPSQGFPGQQANLYGQFAQYGYIPGGNNHGSVGPGYFQLIAPYCRNGHGAVNKGNSGGNNGNASVNSGNTSGNAANGNGNGQGHVQGHAQTENTVNGVGNTHGIITYRISAIDQNMNGMDNIGGMDGKVTNGIGPMSVNGDCISPRTDTQNSMIFVAPNSGF
ncbi:6609_t:CDS:2 [Paraglomus occultum]|uniref:6609_t:CDS:1 n=1 Tax=Paraglomus occultum TaxID=144539 RepID=A0A9N8VZV4_9GLOM|nr:6609_t:CDS:2 [Paraglomus occultum]